MPALPSSSAATGSAVTEADFKAWLTAVRDYLNGLLGSTGTQITGLQTLGALLSNRTDTGLVSSFNVTTAMRGRFIRCEQSLTLNLPALASAGEGFSIAVKNDGASGNVTIDPNLSETVDGSSTIALAPGESCFLYAMSGGWRSVARSVGGDGEFRGPLRVYTSLGSTNWSKPAGLKRIRVTVQAGGGAGGSGTTSTAGGCGGAGGFAVKVIEAASLGSNETVTVGGGGSPAAASGSGGSGGASSFGAHVSCGGGGGGGGSGNGAGAGSGGTNTGGDWGMSGLSGAPGGSTTTGNAASSGTGGVSLFGGPGVGKCGSTATSGMAATGWGSGGGGSTAGSLTAGAGRQGIVIVEEFF